MEYAITNLDKFENNNMNILQMLKTDMRDKALQKIHMPALISIPILSPDFSIDFLKKISRIVKVSIVKPMEELFDVFKV